jgi:hypothetical protein
VRLRDPVEVRTWLDEVVCPLLAPDPG